MAKHVTGERGAADTSNQFQVAPDLSGGCLFLDPPKRGQVLTRGQSLCLSAWLFATAACSGGKESSHTEWLRLVIEILGNEP